MGRRSTRVGVVGAGWVATARHIPSYRGVDDVEVVALYDRARDRAERVAREHRIPAAFSELDAFLDAELDVVSICTPPWTHAELASQALDAGAHVLTEKPMAMDTQEAKSMVAAAQRAGRSLCVSHNFLFSRSVRRADRLVPALGPIGYVLGLQMSNPQRRLPNWYRQLPGGLLFDEAPHMLYTLQHFLGSVAVEDVRARPSDGAASPSIVEVRFRGAQGIGQVTMLFEAPLSEWHIGLVGQQGVADLDLFRDIVVSVADDHRHKPLDILRTSAAAMWGHARGFATSGVRYASRRQFWGHDELIRRFVATTRTGSPPPVDPKDSVGVVSMMDEILTAPGVR